MYTKPSEKYFTDVEMDSLIHDISADIFKENMIPPELFEKKYPGIKTLLLYSSKTGIVQAFKEIETGLQKKLVVDAGSPQFNENKKLYTAALREQLKRTFSKTPGLSGYLSFNMSDRITHYNTTIRTGANGKLLVTEKITVFNGDGRPNSLYGNDRSLIQAGSMNDEIKRGIVRAFPLYYINKAKLFQNTTFSLKEVLKDGKKESYHTKKEQNGIVVYIGSSNTYLATGRYTYSITYETNHQLKLLKDYDELYWNVTGNSWSFRIDSATCTIILPKGAVPLSSKCYTGPQGAANEDCKLTTTTTGDSTVVVFKTTKPLLPKQGITIATSWPKGFIKSPGAWQQVKYWIWNNKAVFFLPLAALFSAIFCFIFWRRYGRDPEKGTVYPQFEPPAGYSPAALGYIYYKKYSRQLTAATIVDAAVRNKIKIDVEREGLLFKHNEYHIRKSDKASKSPQTHYNDFDSDIEDLVGTTIEKGKYNSDLGDLNKTVQKHCEETYKNKDGGFRKGYRGMFSLNSSYTVLPILICVAAGIWALIGGLFKALMLRNFWQIAYFIGGWILCSMILRVFSKLLTAYSPEGRKLMDKIEGFRMFLSTADEKRFDMMNPPEKSLELFEKYLPFAIALGCEVEWGQKFEDIINTAYLGGTGTSSFSQSFTRDNKSFSSSFASSFSGAISSASSPPSS
ncbi:MAG: DUF2207 domain-containing protein, partial [Chitinophagaceae bacterium]